MTGDGRVERYADFASAPDVRAPQTWQVPRATFDHLLLRHAAASGADVREQHRVLDVAFDDGGVTGTVQGVEGGPAPHAVRAQAIVDASGRGALLSRKFDLRIDEPRLANLAVFSHYSGVPRGEGRRAGDIRIVAREDLGWFWMIPISDELMSVGVVLPRSAARALQELEHGALLDRTIAETPVVARLLASARREWPVRIEKDFSFGWRAYAGDRWVLAGDAGSFLDPVFSTGVAIALESGLEAAQTAPAVPRLPPVRPRVLHAGVPRSVFRRRAAAPDVPCAGHGLCRLLAPLARNAHLGRPLLPARSPAAVGAVRSAARREPARRP